MSDDAPFANYLTVLCADRLWTADYDRLIACVTSASDAVRDTTETRWVNYLQWALRDDRSDETKSNPDEQAARFAMAFLALKAREENGWSTDLSIFRGDRSYFTSAHEMGHAYLSRKHVIRTLKAARRILATRDASAEDVQAELRILLRAAAEIVRVRVRGIFVAALLDAPATRALVYSFIIRTGFSPPVLGLPLPRHRTNGETHAAPSPDLAGHDHGRRDPARRAARGGQASPLSRPSHSLRARPCRDRRGGGGALFHIEGSAHAVRINARWLLTFDWDAALCRAHSLSLDKI